MSGIGFLARRLRRMDAGAMMRAASSLREQTGKSRAFLLADMVVCAIRYGAGYTDYRIAEFYRLTAKQRATHITRGVSNAIVAAMNDKAYWRFFDDKAQFNALFAPQLGREWIDAGGVGDAEFALFLRGKDALIAKPMYGSSGQGIRLIRPDDYGDASALRAELIAEGANLVEERIVQHEVLDAICPTSVNTLRVATMLGDKKEGAVYAYLRIGNGAVMDNVDCGGMAAPVDLESGVVSGVGADKRGARYERHPQTGAHIRGAIIPFWREALSMCEEAASVVPQVRYVAWDVAITPSGPVFIEGNSFPSHAIPQFAAHFPDGIGILPRYKEFIDLK